MAGPRGHGRILMNETTDATAIFAPLWRRKWLILAVGIVVGVASYFYYKGQQAVYSANTSLYLGIGNEEQAPGERTAAAKPGVTVADQSAVINTIVVEKVRQRLRAEGQAELLKGAKMRAKAAEKGSEFITISTEAHTPRGAALLANLIAQTYIKREEANHRRAVEKAIGTAGRQVRRLEAANVPKTAPGATASKGKAPASSPP